MTEALADTPLLARLRAVARERAVDADPAHDYLHVARVADNAARIAAAEGADHEIAVGAALLHELFNFPKDHPESHRSGEVCAEHAAQVLAREGCAPERAAAICDAIRFHGFSRGVRPASLEARVLQDADRLDAIGAVGVARCFATGSAMRRPFYAERDPLCRAREPDDKRFTVDHFFRKLLALHDGLHTATARAMGAERAAFMKAFLAQFEAEIAPTSR